MSAKKYPRESILRSRMFSGYQKDFLAAILTKPEYTISEAKRAISAKYKK